MKKICILCLVLVLAASMLTACRGGNVDTTTAPATTTPVVTTAPTRPTTMPTQATTAPTAPITTPATSPSTGTDGSDGTDSTGIVPDATGEMGRARTRRAS